MTNGHHKDTQGGRDGYFSGKVTTYKQWQQDGTTQMQQRNNGHATGLESF